MKKIYLILLFLGCVGFAQTGIGTTAPVNKLQVETTLADPANSGVAANGNLRLSGTTGSHVLDFGLSSAATYSWLQARSKSAYGTTYNLVLNPIGGRVGIGNTSPSQTLDVTGTGRFSSSLINAGMRTYFGKDGANMHWLASSDAISEPNSLAYGFESNGTSIQSHKWYTGGTERMQLSNLGKVGLGTPSPGTSLHIENGNTFGSPANTNSPSIYVMNTNNASSVANSTIAVRTAGTGGGKPYYSLDISGAFGYSMGINNPTDQMILNTSWDFNTTAANNAIIINRSGRSRVMIPEQGGSVATDWPAWGGGLATYDICAASIFASNYATRSDRRLKNTILTIDSSTVSKYLNLRPVTFYWNQDKPRDPSMQFGLIAQEVEILFPEMVNTGTDEMQTKSVNYQSLHALSLKVIQEQQKQIEMLQQKQAALEQRLLLLESKK